MIPSLALTESCIKAYKACLYAGMLPGQLEAQTLINLALAMQMTLRERAAASRRSQIFLTNYEMWGQFNEACSHARCTLDRSTRSDIMTLSLFVEKQTRRIIVARELKSKDVDTLVTINRNFGTGLFNATARETRWDNPSTRVSA